VTAATEFSYRRDDTTFFSQLNFQMTLRSEKRTPDTDVFSTTVVYSYNVEIWWYLKLKYCHLWYKYGIYNIHPKYTLYNIVKLLRMLIISMYDKKQRVQLKMSLIIKALIRIIDYDLINNEHQ